MTPREKREQQGQAMVEFALTITMVLFIMFFIFEVLMFMYTYNVLAYSAKEGVRYAIVHGTGNSVTCTYPCTGSPSSTSAAVVIVVQNVAMQSFHNINNMTVTVSYPDGGTAPPNRVQVTASYTYGPYTSLNWYPPPINATAAGRILN
jgi:hypothetical protein